LHREKYLGSDKFEQLKELLRQSARRGIMVNALPPRRAAGVVALDDALSVAPDFLLLRTTRRSLDNLLARFDLSILQQTNADIFKWLTTSRDVLLLRSADSQAAGQGSAFLTAYDQSLQARIGLALTAPVNLHYIESWGVQIPCAGLRVLRLDDATVDLPLPARL
jgi:hypothetical protein